MKNKDLLFNTMASLTSTASTTSLSLYFLKKINPQNISEQDALDWVLTISAWPHSFYNKHEKDLTNILKNMTLKVATHKSIFFALMNLADDENKHNVLFSVLQNLPWDVSHQTYFVWCLLHNKEFQNLSVSSQNNLYMKILDMWNIDCNRNAVEFRQNFESHHTSKIPLSLPSTAYNVFLAMARQAPEDAFCFLVSRQKSLSPTHYMTHIPASKKIWDCLLHYHPTFMTDHLNAVLPENDQTLSPLLSPTHSHFLKTMKPELHEIYMQCAREHIAEKERALLCRNLRDLAKSSRPRPKM